jgi:hypothetical protein
MAAAEPSRVNIQDAVERAAGEWGSAGENPLLRLSYSSNRVIDDNHKELKFHGLVCQWRPPDMKKLFGRQCPLGDM